MTPTEAYGKGPMTLEEWKKQSLGGDHYRAASRGGVQPIDLILSHRLSWLEGEAIAAICRWRTKNGLADVKKAIGLLQLLVSLEEEKPRASMERAPPVRTDSLVGTTFSGIYEPYSDSGPKNMDDLRYGGRWLGDQA